MKADFTAWCNRPTPACSAFLYGSDEGYLSFCQTTFLDVLRERRGAEVEKCTQDALLVDPTPLQNQPSLFCATPAPKIVVIEDATDKSMPLLERADTSVFCVFFASPGASVKRLKEAHEKATDRLMVSCYINGAAEKVFFVDTLLKKHQVKAEVEAHQFLVQRAEEASALLPSEIAKCALYSQGAALLSFSDVTQCCGDPLGYNVADLVHAVAAKERVQVVRQYQKAALAGAEDILILRMLSLQFARLLSLHEMVQQGQAVDQALRALRPPVFFKAYPQLKMQLQKWSTPRLIAAMEKLRQRESEIKQGRAQAQTAMGRFLLQLTSL